MRNHVVTDISVRETHILQTGISLIKHIYQSKVFFDMRVSILYKLCVLEISPGNVIIMLTHQIVIILKMASKEAMSPPKKKNYTAEEAVCLMYQTDDELSDLTDNDFTDSGSEILESETEESVYLGEEDDDEQIIPPPSPPQM